MSSIKLQATNVFRAGVTARRMKFETDDVELTESGDALRVSFQMKSKGSGTSEVWVDVEAGDFPEFLKIMTGINRKAAMTAMSAELADIRTSIPESVGKPNDKPPPYEASIFSN